MTEQQPVIKLSQVEINVSEAGTAFLGIYIGENADIQSITHGLEGFIRDTNWHLGYEWKKRQEEAKKATEAFSS